MSEQWRPVAGFPQYEVSDLGRVRNVDWRGMGPRLLKPAHDGGGYQFVRLCRDGEVVNQKVHRLVCAAFHGPAPAGTQCAHNDGNRDNNRAENLRWATIVENMADKRRHGTHLEGERHGKSKLTEQLVRQIRASSEDGETIARRLGLRRTTISAVRRRLTWRHVA